jgi:release factor glutamine methyltransferase
MTLHAALLQGTRLLEDAGVPVARLTAEVLLGHAIGHERTYLYGHPEQEVSDLEWLHYGRYLYERLKGKPTQYITRRQEFYGREFRVSPDALIPRPETEHVVETALRCAIELKGRLEGPLHVLDVGTGTGALAVSLQLETGAKAWATDISPAAAALAAENARRLGAAVNVVICDLMEAICARSMDLIVSNPPYVPLVQREGLQREVRDWEPHVALFAGETGFEIYRRIVADAPRVLRPGGWLVMELGFGCSDHVGELLAGWRDVRIEPDLAGIPRVIAARRPER